MAFAVSARSTLMFASGAVQTSGQSLGAASTTIAPVSPSFDDAFWSTNNGNIYAAGAPSSGSGTYLIRVPYNAGTLGNPNGYATLARSGGASSEATSPVTEFLTASTLSNPDFVFIGGGGGNYKFMNRISSAFGGTDASPTAVAGSFAVPAGTTSGISIDTRTAAMKARPRRRTSTSEPWAWRRRLRARSCSLPSNSDGRLSLQPAARGGIVAHPMHPGSSVVVEVGGVPVALNTIDRTLVGLLEQRFGRFLKPSASPAFEFDVVVVPDGAGDPDADLQVQCERGHWRMERGDFLAERDLGHVVAGFDRRSVPTLSIRSCESCTRFCFRVKADFFYMPRASCGTDARFYSPALQEPERPRSPAWLRKTPRS